MNYKIKVENEAESKEAQELFFELGAKRRNILENWKNNDYQFAWFALGKSGELFNEVVFRDNDSGISCSSMYKEITLPQLRDLVVLKRNDPKDANVSEENCLYDLYLTQSKELYFYHCGKKKWILSNLSGDEDYHKLLKPITKEEGMKEYLTKNSSCEYQLVNHCFNDDDIEVPKGADIAACTQLSGKITFFKDGGYSQLSEGKWRKCGIEVDGIRYHDIGEFLSFGNGAQILWKRETPNDKVASAETARQADKVLKEILDGGFEGSDAFIESNVEQSGVDKTLLERESQYGRFEDVAHVTQGMISLMRQCGYDDMPQPHQMALSMIASKMARIVNGDCNHLDSWHDIGGYSKLIENLIEGK